MPYFLDAHLIVRGHRIRVCGYVGEFQNLSDSIYVHGHTILKGDILDGPTYTVTANLKDYINFRGIEMESFNRKNTDAADNEYRVVANGLREKLRSQLANQLSNTDRETVVRYFDMQVIIEQKHSDRVRLINRHLTRIIQNHKQVLQVMRSSEHAKVKRPIQRCRN